MLNTWFGLIGLFGLFSPATLPPELKARLATPGPEPLNPSRSGGLW